MHARTRMRRSAHGHTRKSPSATLTTTLGAAHRAHMPPKVDKEAVDNAPSTAQELSAARAQASQLRVEKEEGLQRLAALHDTVEVRCVPGREVV